MPVPQERALAAILLRVATDEPADARVTATALVTVLTALAVMVSRQHWDVKQFGLLGKEIELRTSANGHFYGRVMLMPKLGSKSSLQARLVAVTLANQAGRALSNI